MRHEDRDGLYRGDYLLCHGIGHKSGGGLVSHAWVEHGDAALTMGILNGRIVKARFDRRKFYADFRAEVVTRYTLQQAAEMEAKHGPAPWVPQYRKLCSDLIAKSEEKRL